MEDPNITDADAPAVTPSNSLPAAPPPDELTITFRKPIQLGGVTYDHLTLREPLSSQWEKWEPIANPVTRNMKAIAIVSGLPEPAVGMLGVRDLQSATDYLNAFFA